jgi:hypothetical protein
MPDELTIYFASLRTDGGAKGNLDIWMARRSSVDEQFGLPRNVAKLNTPLSEYPTWISADGCRLYIAKGEANDSFDIYVATRRNAES